MPDDGVVGEDEPARRRRRRGGQPTQCVRVEDARERAAGAAAGRRRDREGVADRRAGSPARRTRASEERPRSTPRSRARPRPTSSRPAAAAAARRPGPTAERPGRRPQRRARAAHDAADDAGGTTQLGHARGAALALSADLGEGERRDPRAAGRTRERGGAAAHRDDDGDGWIERKEKPPNRGETGRSGHEDSARREPPCAGLVETGVDTARVGEEEEDDDAQTQRYTPPASPAKSATPVPTPPPSVNKSAQRKRMAAAEDSDGDQDKPTYTKRRRRVVDDDDDEAPAIAADPAAADSPAEPKQRAAAKPAGETTTAVGKSAPAGSAYSTHTTKAPDASELEALQANLDAERRALAEREAVLATRGRAAAREAACAARGRLRERGQLVDAQPPQARAARHAR